MEHALPCHCQVCACGGAGTVVAYVGWLLWRLLPVVWTAYALPGGHASCMVGVVDLGACWRSMHS